MQRTHIISSHRLLVRLIKIFADTGSLTLVSVNQLVVVVQNEIMKIPFLKKNKHKINKQIINAIKAMKIGKAAGSSEVFDGKCTRDVWGASVLVAIFKEDMV